MQKHHLVGRLCPKGDKKESVFEPKAKFTLKCMHVLAKFMVNNSTVLLGAPFRVGYDVLLMSYINYMYLT